MHRILSVMGREALPSVGNALKAIVIVAVLALASGARADSIFAHGAGGGSPSAHLVFKIVIPSVLIVDTRSGTVYSNDHRTLVRPGRTDVADLSDGASSSRAVVVADADRDGRGSGVAVTRIDVNHRRLPGGTAAGAAGTVRLSRADPAHVFCMP